MKLISFFFFSATLFLSSGCRNLRFLKDDEALFRANKIRLETKEEIKKQREFEKELKSLSQMQPNKKFLGLFKTRLWFYNVASRGKGNKFRSWMRNKAGEPPMLYDSLLAAKSTGLISNFLKNKGYFYAKVSYETYFEKQRATTTYIINTGDLYRIRSVTFPSDTSRISRIITEHRAETFLKRKAPFDVADLKKERDRISDLLRNEGYYFFNREYVYFDIDSTKEEDQLDLSVKISPPKDSSEHKIYHIDQVYVFTEYSLDKSKEKLPYDTVDVNEFHFISEKLRYRPRILIYAIHFGRDSLFRKSYHTGSVSHLSELGVFKYINLEYLPKVVNGKNYLDCIVNLSPAKKQEVGIEFEANNNTDYNLGTSLTLSYRNKNIFRGTEQLHFSVSGGFESNLERGKNFFNTLDLLARVDFYFNKFLIPFRVKFSQNIKPKTRISFRNEFLRRIEYYTTNTSSLLFGYEWSKEKTRRHYLNPVAVNFVRIIESTPEFERIKNSSPSLKNSFTQQLILGMEYTYLWSNQTVHRGRSFWYYTGNINSSGNLLHLGKFFLHLKDDQPPPYEIFSVEYSQYFLIDSDLRNYFKISRGIQLVTRLFGGVGVPYGNSKSLTYVKQFFSGGTNSMRGWLIRALGPGSFNFDDIYGDTDNFFFDQTGEMKLEANLEYRFDIFKFFKGALFLDMGNIWILREDTARIGANFDITRAWKEFAIATGLGLRFDFNYFVLRVDLGIKVREPASGKQRWPIRHFQFKDIRPNIAIGYPF